MTNFVQEANYFDNINSSQRSDIDINESESDFNEEEEYWYSVEKDRYKEQLGDLEYCEDIYENLREEYGNNMSNDFHELVIATTLSIIEDYEKLYKTELNEESYDKMICEIYPEICALFNN